jgi:predicted protein tyrosine phosphatase
MRILFVCNQGKHRSKTAEEIFKNKYETRSAGLYNEDPLKKSDLEWADLIIVMEDFQRTEISKRFPKEYLKKRILSWNIPDIYSYMQPDLVKILKQKMRTTKCN